MQQDVQTELTRVIPELLARRPGGARFVVELHESLRSNGGEAGDLETALSELERNGTVLIREHGCADPHLEGADLRVAALVDYKNMCGDPIGAAVSAIESTWQRWLGDYLANHRCT